METVVIVCSILNIIIIIGCFFATLLVKNYLPSYMDEKGKFHLEYSKPIAYSHGTYFSLGEELGKFGYSVRKK